MAEPGIEGWFSLLTCAGCSGASSARSTLSSKQSSTVTTTPTPSYGPRPPKPSFAGWFYDDNYTGWSALLGGAAADLDDSVIPRRVKDLTGLARAYIEVGGLDIFRQETVDYAMRLSAAGISVELHVHPGCPHGFDRIGAEADVVKRARADRIRAIRTI